MQNSELRAIELRVRQVLINCTNPGSRFYQNLEARNEEVKRIDAAIKKIVEDHPFAVELQVDWEELKREIPSFIALNDGIENLPSREGDGSPVGSFFARVSLDGALNGLSELEDFGPEDSPMHQRIKSLEGTWNYFKATRENVGLTRSVKEAIACKASPLQSKLLEVDQQLQSQSVPAEETQEPDPEAQFFTVLRDAALLNSQNYAVISRPKLFKVVGFLSESLSNGDYGKEIEEGILAYDPALITEQSLLKFLLIETLKAKLPIEELELELSEVALERLEIEREKLDVCTFFSERLNRIFLQDYSLLDPDEREICRNLTSAITEVRFSRIVDQMIVKVLYEDLQRRQGAISEVEERIVRILGIRQEGPEQVKAVLGLLGEVSSFMPFVASRHFERLMTQLWPVFNQLSSLDIETLSKKLEPRMALKVMESLPDPFRRIRGFIGLDLHGHNEAIKSRILQEVRGICNSFLEVPIKGELRQNLQEVEECVNIFLLYMKRVFVGLPRDKILSREIESILRRHKCYFLQEDIETISDPFQKNKLRLVLLDLLAGDLTNEENRALFFKTMDEGIKDLRDEYQKNRFLRHVYGVIYRRPVDCLEMARYDGILKLLSEESESEVIRVFNLAITLPRQEALKRIAGNYSLSGMRNLRMGSCPLEKSEDLVRALMECHPRDREMEELALRIAESEPDLYEKVKCLAKVARSVKETHLEMFKRASQGALAAAKLRFFQLPPGHEEFELLNAELLDITPGVDLTHPELALGLWAITTSEDLNQKNTFRILAVNRLLQLGRKEAALNMAKDVLLSERKLSGGYGPFTKSLFRQTSEVFARLQEPFEILDFYLEVIKLSLDPLERIVLLVNLASKYKNESNRRSLRASNCAVEEIRSITGNMPLSLSSYKALSSSLARIAYTEISMQHVLDEVEKCLPLDMKLSFKRFRFLKSEAL